VSCLLDWERFAAPSGIQYLLRVASNKKPPATVSRGALFSRTGDAGSASQITL
jgi:hypothetical protein